MIVERDLEKALKPYIVERALPLVLSMLQSEGVRLAFSDRKGRTLGYYMAPKSNRKLSNKQSFDQLHTISLQVNLSPYALLFIFIHEWAHLITVKKYGEVSAHGWQWKKTFKELFIPFLTPSIFPKELLEAIHLYFQKTSRFFDSQINEACLKYGKDRKDFHRIYKKNIKQGIVIPAPYMDEDMERLKLKIINSKLPSKEIDFTPKSTATAEVTTTEAEATITEAKATITEAVNALNINDSPPCPIGSFSPKSSVLLQNQILKIEKIEMPFVYCQNIKTGQFLRIHHLVEVCNIIEVNHTKEDLLKKTS